MRTHDTEAMNDAVEAEVTEGRATTRPGDPESIPSESSPRVSEAAVTEAAVTEAAVTESTVHDPAELGSATDVTASPSGADAADVEGHRAAESGSGADSDARSEAGSGADSDAGSGADSDARSEAGSGADSDAGSGADPGAAARPDPRGEASPDGEEVAERASSGVSRREQLEREGEVAADFLETLLDICDLDGDIDVDIDGDRAAVSVVDSDEGRVPRRLVGDDARVLDSLQELTRLAVQSATGERSRLMLDVAGHRAARRAQLVTIAQAAITEVKEQGERRSLDPMTAFERKVVHDQVLAAGLVSESEGVEPRRFVVILPA